MAAKRAAIAAAAAQAAAHALRDLFLSGLTMPPGSLIAAYAAFGSELDLAPLMQELHRAGHRLALPVVAGRGQPLVFRSYAFGQALVPNRMGINEPAAGQPALDPDILLVPLLAFDRQHRRLGYGNGYYDRTLETLAQRKAVTAIGIGFACQEVDAVPAGPHDIRLDCVVTEREIL